jgi:hypothetical protein
VDSQQDVSARQNEEDDDGPWTTVGKKGKNRTGGNWQPSGQHDPSCSMGRGDCAEYSHLATIHKSGNYIPVVRQRKQPTTRPAVDNIKKQGSQDNGMPLSPPPAGKQQYRPSTAIQQQKQPVEAPTEGA